MGLLEGKVAIVTGAGRGIGREHALLLAKEGADVMINDLGGDGRGEGSDLTPAEEVAEEVRALGVKAAVNGANVADWAATEALVSQTVDQLGGLDILVNNAGILRDKMSFNMSEEDFDLVVDVVFKGTFAPSRHAAAYWRQKSKQTDGPVDAVIINTSSEAGLYGNMGQANYAPAKAAVAALTVTMARDLQRTGVRVNGVAPAAMTRLLSTVMPEGSGPAEGEYNPMSPSQISPLVVWLCSELGKDINGQLFAVDGRRIQLLRGWHPGSQITSDGQDWTIERIQARREQLVNGLPTDIPPFMPPFEG